MTIYKVSDSQSIRIGSIQAIEKTWDECGILVTFSSQVMRLDVSENDAGRVYDEMLKLMEQHND